ncbi:hypothetical protein M8818_001892 [Zalaria obscura]|uniref:Uncharacterized protein n=1 Tax=Zalaria obscura TaxID=2024903 RepID=A0ACC3SMX5_9PEZI
MPSRNRAASSPVAPAITLTDAAGDTTTNAAATNANDASPRAQPQRSMYSAEQRGNFLRTQQRPNAPSREPSIRIRRVPSASTLGSVNHPRGNNEGIAEADQAGGSRRRSFSNPERMRNYFNNQPPIEETGVSRKGSTNAQGRPQHLQSVAEEGRGDSQPPTPPPKDDASVPSGADNPARPADMSRLRKYSVSAMSAMGMGKGNGSDKPRRESAPEHDEYTSEMVDYLDVMDPEIATLSTLTNVQNSLFIPDLGKLLNRRPTYTLTARPTKAGPSGPEKKKEKEEEEEEEMEMELASQLAAEERPEAVRMESLDTINSRLSESRYAVLPHGVSLEGWTEAEKAELNDHVRHLLHSKRAAFKRSLKGFGQYVRRPLGFFVTVYATLITLFGLAWVLFLIGWINVGGRQLYIINVIDNVLVALFALIGDGLAPFRVVDTYHMIFIAHYHHLTWRLRKERNLPKLIDHNDLPARRASDNYDYELRRSVASDLASIPDNGSVAPDGYGLEGDIEAGALKPIDPKGHVGEYTVLNVKQQARLKHHQTKFAKSHTFYKPHETTTHRAFPLRLLVAVVVLLDFHSIFQIALGTCTWSIDYKTRPFALTTVILCCSITCNITAGIIISIGDKRSRKKQVVERLFRQQVTETAIKKIERRREREERRNAELSETVVPEMDDMGMPRRSTDKWARSSFDGVGVRRSGEKGRRSFDLKRKAGRSLEGRRSMDVQGTIYEGT